MREKTALARAFDTVFGFLMRPRIRRLRRWSFFVTLPGALIAANVLEIRLTLGTGLKAGIAAAILETVLLLVVGVLGARVLGRERRDVLLDFLMHPMARRAVAGEIRTLLVVPRALWRRLRRPRSREFAYHRGSNELGFALAILPAAVAEGAAVHLLLHGAPTWLRLGVAALHLYGLLMLLGLALGSRVHPHRVTDRLLQLRVGHLTRADVPLAAVASLQRRRLRGRAGLVLEEEEAIFLSEGRADLRIELREPVLVKRALRDPVAVSRLIVAVDDAEGLVKEVRRAQGLAGTEVRQRSRLLGWLAPADLFEAVTA